MANRKRTKGPMTSPSTIVPDQDFINEGFGTIRVPAREWRSRIAATSFTLHTIKTRAIPENSLQMHHSLHMVRDMFRRINAGDSYDWFSTSRLLGHPSAELCKSLSLDLITLRNSIRDSDAMTFNRAVDQFKENFGDAMLENYLRMTVDHGHLVREEGWAYILWSSSYRDVLHIGAAAGEVEQVLRSLNAEHPGQHPFGVLAAWLVHDPAFADQDILETFRRHALGNGFFELDLGMAKDRISTMLRETNNFALSPWHDYELDQGMQNASTAPVRGAVG